MTTSNMTGMLAFLLIYTIYMIILSAMILRKVKNDRTTKTYYIPQSGGPNLKVKISQSRVRQ
jgi:hypothetical protein